MKQLQTIWQNLPPRGRVALVGGAVGTLLVAFLLYTFASRPSYTMVVSGLEPGESTEVTDALDKRGVAWELRNNGTAIAVEKASVAQARAALKDSGVAGGGSNDPGFELFDKQKLGASDFQQKVSYQRALEGEIARTVSSVDGVKGVQVQLVLADDRLFADESSPATAAVLLEGSADGLDPGATRGIAQLVAGSVEGLETKNVTITDGAGRLLWPTDDAAAGGVGGSSKQALEQRFQAQLQASIGSLLASSLGPDKARVQVRAALNADRATRSELRYGKKGVELKRSRESENLQSEGGGAATPAAGSSGNIPDYAGGGANGGQSEYEREKDDTELGVDKTVTKTEVAPGAVEKLDVAVIVDKSVPASQVQALRPALSAAAGIDATRGDTLALSQVAFSKDAGKTEAKVAPAAMMGYLKWLPVLAGLIILAGLAVRHLRRREDEVLAGEPVWLREISAPRTLAELETAAMAPLAEPDPMRRQVEDFAEQEPERVATLMRAWMEDGE